MNLSTIFTSWGFLTATMQQQFFFLFSHMLTSLPNYSCYKILQELLKSHSKHLLELGHLTKTLIAQAEIL